PAPVTAPPTTLPPSTTSPTVAPTSSNSSTPAPVGPETSAPTTTPPPSVQPVTPAPTANSTAGNDTTATTRMNLETFAEGAPPAGDNDVSVWLEDVDMVQQLPLGGGGTGNGTVDVTWSNAAAVRATRGFDPNLWVSANYVAKITGLLYNDLSGWSSDYKDEHEAYQPLSACGGSSGAGKTNFKATGSSDSYDFVWSAFERLASNGVIFEHEVVLPPRRTTMCLFAKEDDADLAQFVSAKGNDQALEYYRRTNKCITDLAAAAAAGNATYPGGGACTSQAMPRKSATAGGGGSMYADGEAEGAVSLLLGVGGCLGGETHAFLYHNESTLIRLPLPGAQGPNDTAASTTGGLFETIVSARKSGTTPTAGLVRYAPAMPARPPAPPGGSDRAWIVYIAVAVVAICLAAAAIREMFRRKRRADLMRAYGMSVDGAGPTGGLFSSQAGAGWRSGGRDAASTSDFGEFDSGFGGGYGGGVMFPGDSYGSGSLGMSAGSGQGSSRMSWRGRGNRGGGG
ncbi:unnamed protein product, partial [Sphacelaria rigidula]